MAVDENAGSGRGVKGHAGSAAVRVRDSKTVGGFKDFILKGDVISIAVGLAIAAAFAALVKSVTESFVNPILASLGTANSIQGFGIQLGDCNVPTGCPKTFLDFGAIISAFITFLLTAAVIYFFIVTPYMKARELARRNGEQTPEEEAVDEQLTLLREIRDALTNRAPEAGGGEAPRGEAPRGA